MAEYSWYWGGRLVGDAALAAPRGAPYTDTMYSENWSKIFLYDRTVQGVIPTLRAGYTGNLEVTILAGSTVRILPGLAMVDGRLYENDSNYDYDMSAVGDGSWVWVLRKTTASQVVRLTVIALAVPLTQSAAIWEIPLATVVVAGGVITSIIDRRAFMPPPSSGGMVKIAESILTANGTISWTAIPQIFRSLWIVGTGKVTAYGGGLDVAALNTTFNGDVDANHYAYWGTNSDYTFAPPATDLSAYYSVGTNAYLPLGGFAPGTGVNPGQTVLAIRGMINAMIFDYASTTAYKLVTENAAIGGIAAINLLMRGGGRFVSAAPITSIQMQSGSNAGSGDYNIEAGSVLTLYGLT